MARNNDMILSTAIITLQKKEGRRRTRQTFLKASLFLGDDDPFLQVNELEAIRFQDRIELRLLEENTPKKVVNIRDEDYGI